MSNLLTKTKAAAVTALAAVGTFGVSLAARAQGFASNLQTNVGATGEAIYGSTSSQELPVLVGRIINVVLGFLGVILVVLVIYAGFLWMTASGDEGKVKKAKLILGQAIAGMVLIFAAYSITSFVINSISSATAG